MPRPGGGFDPLALLLLLLTAGCVTSPSAERPPTESVLAEPPARNELPPPRIGPPAESGLPAVSAQAGRPAPPLTLEDGYRLALRQSERLERGGEEVLQAFLRGRKALALALPRLDIEGRVTRQDEPPAFGGAAFFPIQREEYFLSFEVPIFSGFRERYARRQARAEEDGRKAALKDLREEIFLNVTEAFFGLLQARKEMAVREASLRWQEERGREAEARLKAGMLRRAEVELIRAEVARERSDLLRARQNAEVLRTALGFFIGFRPEGELADPETPRTEVSDVPGLVAEAQQVRQDLRALEKEVDAASEEVRVVLGEYWPRIRLEGEYYGRREGSASDVDWEARLNGELPLFDGGLLRARLREAHSRRRQAQLTRDEARRRIEQEVQQAAAQLAAARSLVEALRQQLQAAEESDRLVKAEFDRGLATNLEVLTAQNLLLRSQIDLEREMLEERIQDARLRRLLGRPLAP